MPIQMKTEQRYVDAGGMRFIPDPIGVFILRDHQSHLVPLLIRQGCRVISLPTKKPSLAPQSPKESLAPPPPKKAAQTKEVSSPRTRIVELPPPTETQYAIKPLAEEATAIQPVVESESIESVFLSEESVASETEEQIENQSLSETQAQDTSSQTSDSQENAKPRTARERRKTTSSS